jgi:3-methyladenine DNA glycosylase AlkD
MLIMNLQSRLKQEADKNQAVILQKFFKTGRGEYGEGDIFLGISVPRIRKVAKEFRNIGLEEVQEHLDSEIHEERLAALLILIEQLKKASEDKKKEIFDFYLRNAKNNRINNWDLVDLSCRFIVGEFLLDKERIILYKLATGNLWERRISIVSTYAFIRKGQLDDTIKISELLLDDKHDLIYKAVGWMLRETGKKDVRVLEGFLNKHYKIMPRTMLRYAIEKFPEKKRKAYLDGEV